MTENFWITLHNRNLLLNLFQVYIEDKNDNLPKFESETYYVGIPFDAKVGDLVLDAK
jgi:hypothetical protein